MDTVSSTKLVGGLSERLPCTTMSRIAIFERLVISVIATVERSRRCFCISALTSTISATTATSQIAHTFAAVAGALLVTSIA